MRVLIALCLLAVVAIPAQAKNVTILELLTDTSGSIDSSEFALIRNAYRDIICAPQPGNIFKIDGTLAVAMSEWSHASQQYRHQDYLLLQSQADLDSLCNVVTNWQRQFGSSTAPGSAIQWAKTDMELAQIAIEQNGDVVTRQVIDIAKDGNLNSGSDTQTAVNDANAVGIVVNCLAISGTTQQLCTEVTTASNTALGAFSLEAASFAEVKEALELKLKSEINNEDPNGCQNKKQFPNYDLTQSIPKQTVQSGAGEKCVCISMADIVHVNIDFANAPEGGFVPYEEAGFRFTHIGFGDSAHIKTTNGVKAVADAGVGNVIGAEIIIRRTDNSPFNFKGVDLGNFGSSDSFALRINAGTYNSGDMKFGPRGFQFWAFPNASEKVTSVSINLISTGGDYRWTNFQASY